MWVENQHGNNQHGTRGRVLKFMKTSNQHIEY